MTQDASWPKASEGGRVVGKEEIRAYWTRQCGEFDPHVDLNWLWSGATRVAILMPAGVASRDIAQKPSPKQVK